MIDFKFSFFNWVITLSYGKHDNVSNKLKLMLNESYKCAIQVLKIMQA